MDPSMKIFISSSRFLCNARISSMELLLRCYGPKKTDIGSYRWKATPPESREKTKIYMVEVRYFWCGHLSAKISTIPKKTRSSVQKNPAIIGIMARPLGAEKTATPLGVSGWPTTTTTTTDWCLATVGSEPLTWSWQAFKEDPWLEKRWEQSGLAFFVLFFCFCFLGGFGLNCLFFWGGCLVCFFF